MPVPFVDAPPVDAIVQNLSVLPRGAWGGGLAPTVPQSVLRAMGIVASKPGTTTTKTPPSRQTASFVDVDRRPFSLTSQEWIENKDQNAVKALFCRANPGSVNWTMNLRIATQKTLSGEVQHAWRQNLGIRRNTFFSEPTLGITFQSGNIMPVRFSETGQPSAARMPLGLDNFYSFVDLLGGKRILDPTSGDRRANVVYITYTSHIYPSIVLAGMFTPEGFSFTDNARDPHKVEWTANFTVYDSFPRFDNASQLRNTWYETVPVNPQPSAEAIALTSLSTDELIARGRAQQAASRTTPEGPA